jgi:hypothetical protein
VVSGPSAGEDSDADAVPEQQEYDDDDHDDPNDAVTATAIIATAITPIAATTSKEEDEYDYQKNEGHRTPCGLGMPARALGLMHALQSGSNA